MCAVWLAAGRASAQGDGSEPRAFARHAARRTHTRFSTHTRARASAHELRAWRYRGGLHWQRLGVLVAVMLARERRAPTEHTDGCAPLAASFAALPAGLMKMVAEALAALGFRVA